MNNKFLWPSGLRRVRLHEVSDLTPAEARREGWRLFHRLQMLGAAVNQPVVSFNDEKMTLITSIAHFKGHF